MNLNRPVILTPDIEHRFQTFIIFEPASSRIHDFDILISGPKVKEMYDMLIQGLTKEYSLKTQIIMNRVTKIGQMLELLKSHDHVIISKFFDRIWRRYSYISNIGEPFLDLPNFIKFFPEFAQDRQALLAQRIDDEDDEFSDGGSGGGGRSEERESDSDGVEVESLSDQTETEADA
ncbi:hypothetical protein EBR96_02365 [bacterium]|nr:hypothetical protein [bacterium]